LIKDGADILDIGGESSRPGAEPISELQELERVIPIVRHFASKGNVLISVDTHKSNVAQKALEAGAHIINDITGLADDAMAPIVAGFGAKIIIMHMQGTPQTMQKNPYYKDVLLEIAEFFSQRIGKALAAGIKKENIILDPGIGFGKTLKHNLVILKNIPYFAEKFPFPILVGTSRKGFIGTLTGKQNPQDRAWGTAATVTAAILGGASIIRVHEVKEMKDVASVTDALRFLG